MKDTEIHSANVPSMLQFLLRKNHLDRSDKYFPILVSFFLLSRLSISVGFHNCTPKTLAQAFYQSTDTARASFTYSLLRRHFCHFNGASSKVFANMPEPTGNDEVMEKEELLGLFKVMGELLEDSQWALLHPLPCTETPWPGVQCEIGEDPPFFHITKLHIGPDILNPPCKSSATLSLSLLKLPYLKTLSIFSCFSESPLTLSSSLFAALPSLEHLSLESNPSLSGEIPASVGSIAGLKVLSLSQNSFSGEIPREIGNLTNLHQLDLSFNNLSGEIPREMSGLKSLEILDLSWNNFEGRIPCTLGQLNLLQKIDLSSNKLRGTIPPNIGMLKALVLFDLSSNFINGPLPETLSDLALLEYLMIDQNPLNSEIYPLFLGTLENLRSLSLSGCGIRGSIPISLLGLKNLTALSLDGNNFTGPVPPFLGYLPALNELNLSHNQLSGELSLSESFIQKLGKRLDLRGNKGLCSSNLLYKNISGVLQIPVCLNSSGPNNGVNMNNQNPFPRENYNSEISSNSLFVKNQRIISITLGLSVVLFLLDSLL